MNRLEEQWVACGPPKKGQRREEKQRKVVKGSEMHQIVVIGEFKSISLDTKVSVRGSSSIERTQKSEN